MEAERKLREASPYAPAIKQCFANDASWLRKPGLPKLSMDHDPLGLPKAEVTGNSPIGLA